MCHNPLLWNGDHPRAPVWPSTLPLPSPHPSTRPLCPNPYTPTSSNPSTAHLPYPSTPPLANIPTRPLALLPTHLAPIPTPPLYPYL